MPRDQGLLDFAWARASALLSRSFFEERWAQAAQCRTVAELAQLVFPERDFSLPEKRLVGAFQRALVERSRSEISSVWKGFDPPEGSDEEVDAGSDFAKRRRVHRRAWNLFHSQPCSLAAVSAFCRLKEIEASNLTSLSEALALGLPEARKRELLPEGR